mmetsp:Transcript_10624/g.21260  ORF Transcript_10624/g.21260 Transcript_10624/m.21260 type:complete len:174 (-) Transcript_10624:46-567(-)|eukprot:CAMPEP_0181297680 /NCGR_PEP_ID=MMETSP1101-20121128/5374_1 /TAXON_ID=46948 /ORGANISM="Rhodomonas abbreviata, Strain Caron Lab Isolate" /LENGTH=173 /DNA_ID=CAMNT_0023402643 /DNA_START=74 /DNA_END=595 /DNA_ORIENTATION=-
MAEYLSEDEIAQIQEVFAVFDKKGDKVMPASDLTTLFQALHCNVSNAEITEYLQVLDSNGEGSVQYNDLLPVLARRMRTMEKTDQLLAAFRVFDKQNRGTISPEELRHILSHFGEAMDSTEIDEYLMEADLKAGDIRNNERTGLINYVAFVGVMLDLSEEQIMAMTMGDSVNA